MPKSPQETPRRQLRTIVRVVAALIVLACGLAGAVAAWLYWRAKVSLPQLDGTIKVAGLAGRVEVLRDAHGIPHLRASSEEDVLFAQGFVTAQDRLWQMDLSRRYARGELSEILGESALKLDIESRTLGLPEVCERAFAELDAGSQRMLRAYARGVNAFLGSRHNRLPIEFLILRYRPRPWLEADSFAIALNMARSLSHSWPEELMHERIRAKVAPELYADLFPDHSALDRPVAGAIPHLVPAPKRHPEARLPPNWMSDLALRTLMSAESDSPAGLGSNNWVLSGAHTRSGKPLLANDPHLGHRVPSVWYMIHMKASGLNVSGVTFPGLPAVILGHNERIAWGATNTAPDVQDLYAEEFSLQEPDRYRHNRAWVDADVRDEVIKVRDQADFHLRVRVTRHGPVVSDDRGRSLALRWTALEPRALQFPFWAIDHAQNWQDFVAALRIFAGPMQNFVYADVEGNIGYYAAGRVPIRKHGDGTVPVPGSTDEHDWTGYIPFEHLPHSFNPPGGIIATANGRVVSDDYPYFLTRQWEAPYRTARIAQLLEAGNAFTVPDMLRIQSDIHTLEDVWLARVLVAAAAKRPPQSPDAQYALTLVTNWDGEAKADSAATLVCEVTRRALLERILKPKLGNDLSGYSWPMSSTFLENVVEKNLARWLPPGDADFHATLVRSLEEGVGRIPEIVGSRDRAAWKWGNTIPLTFHHPLGSVGLLGRILNVGPYPQAGTRTTIKQTSPSIGPSMRMVIDFSDLENSVQNITLGESGQIFSPYFKDQFEAWHSGRSLPMLFGDEQVDRHAIHRLVMEPSGKP
ncbi:MAG: penicillin acylase family protein [Terriglobia bacterium]